MAKIQYRNMVKGCEKIHPEGKVKKGSIDLQKRQTNSFQKVSEKYEKKNRGSEKVPYSEVSCSKLISFNQPIMCSMFLVSL